MNFEEGIKKLQNGKTLKKAFIRACSEKACKCNKRTILIDLQNRVLECSECGAILDPFEVVKSFMNKENRYFDNIEALHEERKELEKWINKNRMGSLLRDWASNLRRYLFPVCPSCNDVIDVYKVTGWRHGDYLSNSKIKK